MCVLLGFKAMDLRCRNREGRPDVCVVSQDAIAAAPTATPSSGISMLGGRWL